MNSRVPESMRTVAFLVALAALSGCGRNPFVAKEEYVRRGLQFAAEGKYGDAELQFRRAIQKDKNYGTAYLEYGRLLEQQQRSAEAFRLFSLAVQLMPGSIPAQVRLGRLAATLLLSDPRRPQSYYDAAERMAERLLARDGNSFEGLRLKGFLAVADAHRKDAIEFLRKALQAKPHEPDVAAMLVETLFNERQNAEAESLCRNELAALKSYGPLYDALYAFYLRTGRLSDAEQLLKTKAQENPKETLFVIQLAEHYRAQNRPEDMESVLRGLIGRARELPDALLEAGEFYERAGRPQEALAVYQQALQSGPAHRKEILQRIVAIRIDDQQLAEASAVLDLLLREFPGDLKALAARADLRMATGKPDEIRRALTEFSDLVQKAPQDDDIRYSLARAYRQLNRERDARTALQEILRHTPNHPNALREMADLAIRARKPDEALNYAQKLIDMDPNNTSARLVRTAAWALTGRLFEVRRELRRLTEENSSLPEPWLQTATLELEQKNYAEAERILQRLYRAGSADIRPVKILVGLYLAQGQSQKAMTFAREAAKYSPTEGRILLASTAARTGDLATALSTAQELAADFPDDPVYLLSVGALHQQNGQLDQAIAAFQKARQIAPGDPVAWGYLGMALGQAGRSQEAVTASRQSLKLDPENPMLMNNLAWNLAVSGTSLEEAGALAKRALQKSPNDPIFADTLGMVYLKSHQVDTAVNTFEFLIRKDPSMPAYRIHFALALIEAHQPQRARTQLQVALQNGPAPADEQQAKALLQHLP